LDNCFLIDGDGVRKLLSPEKDYSAGDRTQQSNIAINIALNAKSGNGKN
jgi:adenylylsulfate kinase-like enzyme